MTRMVNIHEAKTHFSKLVEAVHGGEEIVIAKAGKPYARLLPLEPKTTPRRLGLLEGKLSAEEIEESLRPLTEEELELWGLSS